jgi:2-desacetyl-2-hydroxyethyl bacteriochlorophyllide A dehydrogenase
MAVLKSLNIIFPESNKIDIDEVFVSQPNPDEILCKAEKSLISIGTEIQCLKGEYDANTGWEKWVKYPFNPGYSMSARVISVGALVEGLKEGDRVATPACHMQYFTIKSSQATFLPDEVSMEDGTWLTLACTTQIGVRRAGLELGESVGVIGLGMLGQLCVQYLRAAGARRIVAIDPIDMRLRLASKSGATHILNCDAESAIDHIKEITDGKMLDMVMDVTGHPAVLSPATQMVRKLGRVVLLGDAVNPSKQTLGPRVVADSIAILGIHGLAYPQESTVYHPWSKKQMISLFLDYLRLKRMDLSHLITHRISPLDAPEIYKKLLHNRSEAMGIIFDWNQIKRGR